MKTTTIRKIALSDLSLSDKNVRKAKPTQAEEDSLEASIAAHGLKQNLGVEAADNGTFEVLYGGRRFRALQRLNDRGVIDADYKVPCVVHDGNEAMEVSLAENVARAAMHPADEYEAFAGLIDAGASERDVADRFGVTMLHVQKRMKLARVAPEIIACYRDGRITLETLTAFTLTDSHDRQREVFGIIERQFTYNMNSAPMVRRMLTEETVSGRSRLARFVGVEAYEAAGGAVTRDLFSQDDDGIYLDDPALLERLAADKLEKAAEALRGEWRWVETMVDMSWQAFADYGRVYPKRVDHETPALRAEMETVEARLEEMEDIASPTDEEIDENERLVARYDELADAVDAPEWVFSEEARALAGCILTLDHAGDIRREEGLVKPEHIPQADDTESDSDADDTTSDHDGADPDPDSDALVVTPPRSLSGAGGPSAAIDNPETVALKQAGLTAALAGDLRAIRHQIAQAHLAADFGVAFDLMVYSLCRSVFRLGYVSTPIDVSLTLAMTGASVDHLKDTVAERMLDTLRGRLKLDWMELPKPQDFEALVALDPSDKQALFAFAGAQGLVQQLSVDYRTDPVIEAAGRRLEIDVAACWRPTADSFFKRVTKDHMLAAARETIGEEWASEHEGHKKGELADAMEAAFSAEARTRAGLTPDAAARTPAWVPDGMAFAHDGAVESDVDADDEAADEDATSTDDVDTAETAESDDDEEDEALPAFLTGDAA